MPTFLVTATVCDAYRQTVNAHDEAEATAIAQGKPDSWRVKYEENTKFDAQEILPP